MTSRAELEKLSGEELHDLAVRRAAKRLDLPFFWRLLETLPAAEAAAGDLEEARSDLTSVIARVNDLTDAGRGETAEQLRPLYVEYLVEHGVEG